MDDIVDLTEENDSDCHSEEDSSDMFATLGIPIRKKFCLYEELANSIKSLLVSRRKGDPVCCVTMDFDSIYFDGLVSHCTFKSSKESREKYYALSAFSKLNDLLGLDGTSEA